MKKYLTIGEVAKIKDVSHTSLRYYDEIGILVPAYTNPDTGYRYYSKSQMLLLDIILMAIGLGISLKELRKYIDNESIDIEKFTFEAKDIITKSILKLQRDLYFLDSATKYFKDTENILTHNKEHIREIDTRYFLALYSDISVDSEDFEISDYWKQITELYILVKEHELFTSFDQGLYFYRENNDFKKMVYVEIKKIKKTKIGNAKVIKIPKARFICTYYPDSSLKLACEKYLEHGLKNNQILIVSDVLEKKMGKHIMPFIVQVSEGVHAHKNTCTIY